MYPAYASLNAVATSQKDDDTQWLTYWVVFAFFTVLEYFTGLVVSWIPGYYILKFFFLLWLLSPVHKGATTFYELALRPLVVKHNSFGHKISGKVHEVVDSHIKKED